MLFILALLFACIAIALIATEDSQAAVCNGSISVGANGSALETCDWASVWKRHQAKLRAEAKAKKDEVKNRVKWAVSKVGIHEQGSNIVPFLGIYGQPWCAFFATTAAKKGGAKIPVIGSVSAIQSAAQNKQSGFTGWSDGADTAHIGDLVVLDSGGHVGFVAGVNKDGSTTVIEGNYSDKVARNRRSDGEIIGVAHVKYNQKVIRV